MTRLSPARYFGFLGLCVVLLLVAIIVSPGIGNLSSNVGITKAWRAYFAGDSQATAYRIGFVLRMPRTLLALQAGITLGLCGGVFQTLFRNPLATPYTLGIASGGSLGALIAIKLGLDTFLLGIPSRALMAFAGALLVIAIVFVFTRGALRLTTSELLLAGVTMGLFCSAMMMLLTSLSNARQTIDMVRWMMGSLQTVGHIASTRCWPLTLPCWVVLVLHASALNQYSMGEELAASRGVHVARLQVICILFASLATAAVVAVCGPIGFVGLVVPQMTGLLIGRDCRILLPASAMLGGLFLAVCDWLSQLAGNAIGRLIDRDLVGAELPIGVVTAIVGVPIFLILLRRRAA